MFKYGIFEHSLPQNIINEKKINIKLNIFL